MNTLSVNKRAHFATVFGDGSDTVRHSIASTPFEFLIRHEFVCLLSSSIAIDRNNQLPENYTTPV